MVLRAGLIPNGEAAIVIHSVKKLAIVVWTTTCGELFFVILFIGRYLREQGKYLMDSNSLPFQLLPHVLDRTK